MHDNSADRRITEVAAEGGHARAKQLTAGRRAEIARRAATARWAKNLPHVTHSGNLDIGGVIIPCAVLNNQKRVLSEFGITNALLGSRSGASKRLKQASLQQGAPVPIFMAPRQLKSFIPDDLLNGPLQPLEYLHGDRVVTGYDAGILPTVCDIWLRARAAGVLQTQQLDKAMKAEILMRALAHVGIVALVDEATGFQDARARDALAKILEAFVAKELRKWISTFPADYYKELFRLRGWQFPKLPQDQQKRPVMVGKLTNDIVYARLAPGVRQELHRLTPRDEKGRLKHKLFQRLTDDYGHPKLREHLASIVVLMRASDSWDQFMRALDRALPKYRDLPLFDALDAES